MLEYKKFSKSYIGKFNWLFLAHNEFKIVSLNENNIVYQDKEPFGKKYDQIANIVVLEERNLLFLISFTGDFCIYNIDYKSQTVNKKFLYIQKGHYYRSDVYPIWTERSRICLTIEHKNNYIFRSINFSGVIEDLNLDSIVSYVSNCSSTNELLIKMGRQEKKYLGDGKFGDFQLQGTLKSSLKHVAHGCVSLLTKEDLSRKVICICNNDDISYYDSDSFALLKKYKKERFNSGLMMLFNKIINSEIFTVETICDTLNGFSYISGFVFDDNKTRKLQAFSEDFWKKNKMLYLSSFNQSFVTFFSEKNSIILVSIND